MKRCNFIFFCAIVIYTLLFPYSGIANPFSPELQGTEYTSSNHGLQTIVFHGSASLDSMRYGFISIQGENYTVHEGQKILKITITTVTPDFLMYQFQGKTYRLMKTTIMD